MFEFHDSIELKPDTLRLIRVVYPYSAEELEKKLDDVSRSDAYFMYSVNKLVPNICFYLEENYREVDLVDDFLFDKLLGLLVKYNIEYEIKDITEIYFQKPHLFDQEFTDSVWLYMDKIMSVDLVLDRISKVGISKLNKFELHFLERLSKSK